MSAHGRTGRAVAGRARARPLTGAEPFHASGVPLGFDLLGFWRWSASDLASNSLRGILAEYIVARALEVDIQAPREEWAAHDLTMRDGTRIEVKSSAYLQSWHQERISVPRFSIRPSRAWEPESGSFAPAIERQADYYVFALLSHQDKRTIDPLDVDQWVFFILPASALNTRLARQKTIGLAGLEKLAGFGLRYSELAGAFAARDKSPVRPGPRAP